MPNRVFKKIRKRNGRLYKFRECKIERAIAAAGQVTGEFDEKAATKLTRKVIAYLVRCIPQDDSPTVEQVQDSVERILLESAYYNTAKEYILYRAEREKVRQMSSKFNKTLINKYLKRADWQVKENSNMGFSLSGLNNYMASELSKTYWLNEVYPKEIRDSHTKGDLHIHDLSSICTYCMGWDLWDLLVEGFQGVSGKVVSSPAKHFRTALGQIVNYIYTLQNEASGAQAFSSVDTLLAPFIRYDKLTYKEVKQAMQEFVFNMNVSTRQGGQTPFSNITLDLEPSENYRDQNVIVGGKPQDDKYGDFQKEMDWFNKAFCEVMVEGDAHSRVFTFPIPTYNITKDFDWDNPNLDKLWEATAKYGIPYFANYINSDMSPKDSLSMCCFSGNTDITCRVDGKLRFTTLVDLNRRSIETLEVPLNGKWVKAEPVQVPFDGDFYKVLLRNGSEYTITEDHLNPTINGDVRTDNLKVGDMLEYSFSPMELSGVGSYDTGKFIGLYLAEGSHLGGDIQFSLGENETDIVDFITKFVGDNFAAHVCVQPNKGKSISAFVNSSVVRSFIDRFVAGKARDKRLIRINNYSSEMLKGIFDGWYTGDGKTDGKEAYTTSKQLADQMRHIARMLGIATNIRTTDRICRFGDTEYDSRLYTVHLCDLEHGKTYKTVKDYCYTEIVSIKKVPNVNKTAFCVEVKDEAPYFQLSDGLVTHNCRLKLDLKQLRKRGGGLFGAAVLTGSVGVVTMNLPRLARNSENGTDFMRNLGKLMDLAKESLEIKRKVIEDFTEGGLYPYTKFYLRNTKKRFNRYWANHFSTIGLVGMNEACINLLGDGVGTTRGSKFAEKVLTFMRNRLLKYQDETGNNYNLEATPAEGTAYRLALKDKKSDKEIICANEEAYKEGAEPYYTNSSNLPVGYTDDLFEALDHQDKLQPLYTGGTVFHTFLGEAIDDPNMAKLVVKKICSSYSIPYVSLTPTFSVCPKHGYLSGEHKYCPKCDEIILNELEKKEAK